MTAPPVAATVTPVNHTTPTVLTKAFGPVPAGQEWSVSVRVAVSGGADDTFDLKVRKTDGTNAAYRCKAHPVANGSGTYDIETRLVLPAGFELWDRSGAGFVDASYTATMRVAP